MNFHNVEQNTDDWWKLKVAKLSGSSAGKVMANYGKAFGEPAKKLAISLAREMVTGKTSIVESYSNAHMERGHEQEPIARALYEELTFTDVTNGGFFEDERLGCSPDGLVNNDGIIEIKSVLDHVHYNSIKRNNVDPAYKWQVYFNLKVIGRDWIDFVSYCADYPEDTRLFIFRVNKEDVREQFEMLDSRIHDFLIEVDKAKQFILGE